MAKKFIKKNNFQKKEKETNNEKTYRVNDEIHYNDSVRLIYKPKNGEEGFNKVVHIHEARNIADEMELDLIEINANANPPIIRLENYSKFMYELKKQAKEKTKTKNVLKEIHLSTNISEHDLLIKAKKAKEFIEDGNKVKVTLTMRGRELARREESKRCLYQFILSMQDVATPESMPKDENNKAMVILKKRN